MTTEQNNAIARVQSLIELTEQLTEIFKQENAFLAEQRASEIVPLQEEKARLAAAYAQSIRSVAHDRSCLNGANDALIETLRDITKSFEQNAQHQRALLDGAQMASEGLMNAVLKEADKSTTHSYANNVGKATKRNRPSLVLNETA